LWGVTGQGCRRNNFEAAHAADRHRLVDAARAILLSCAVPAALRRAARDHLIEIVAAHRFGLPPIEFERQFDL
jgi:hypothetical protein